MKPSAPALIFAASVVQACAEPLSPSQFVGTYQLSAVNGIRLPVTVAALPDSCTTQFSYGTLILGDGAFTFYYSSVQACPGFASRSGLDWFGGGLTVQGHSLVLRAIDPTSPTRAVIEARFSLAGSEGDLVLPAGALQLASTTTLSFGPSLQAVRPPAAAPAARPRTTRRPHQHNPAATGRAL